MTGEKRTSCPYGKRQVGCMELSYGIDDMTVESLCVRIRRQPNKDHIVVTVTDHLIKVRKWMKPSSNMEVS